MSTRYKDFLADALALYKEQESIISVKHDAEKRYTETDIRDVLSACMSAAMEKNENLSLLSSDLEEIQNRCLTDNSIDLDKFHEEIQKYSAAKKGKSLIHDPEEIEKITKNIEAIDEKITEFAKQRLHFFKPQFSQVRFVDHDSSTASLLISDSRMKLACFMGASFASSLHLIRDTTNITTGFLSRVVLSRSLLESCIHQIFVLRKVEGLLTRIQNAQAKKSVEQLELLPNILEKSMYGTSSPVYTVDQYVSGYHINSCIKTLDRPIGKLNKIVFEELYDHLCDFTHPNLGMRELMLDLIEHAPGDYYCSAIKIDPKFGYHPKNPPQNDVVLRSLDLAIVMLTESLNIYEGVQKQIDEKEEKIRKLGEPK